MRSPSPAASARAISASAKPRLSGVMRPLNSSCARGCRGTPARRPRPAGPRPLRPHPPETADQHRIRVQPQLAPQGGAVGGGVEHRGIDPVQDHRRRALQIGRGLRRGRDQRLLPADQPAGEAGMAPLRRAGEQQPIAPPQQVAQDQPQRHFGVAPRVPDPPAVAGQGGGAGQRDMRQLGRQPRPGRHDADHPRLHRDQPHHRGGDARQPPLEVGGDDLDPGRLNHGSPRGGHVEQGSQRHRQQEEQEQHHIGRRPRQPLRRLIQRARGELHDPRPADRDHVEEGHPRPTRCCGRCSRASAISME